jgi:hypothetical protein
MSIMDHFPLSADSSIVPVLGQIAQPPLSSPVIAQRFPITNEESFYHGVEVVG